MRLAEFEHRAARPAPRLAAEPAPSVQRVLMTADAVGGVWRYTVDLAGALRTRGIEVTLAVMGPPPSLAQRSSAAALGIDLVALPFKLEWMDDAWGDVDRAGTWLLDLERALDPDIIHLNGYSHAALPWLAPVVTVAHSCVCSWWRGVHGTPAPPQWTEYRQRVIKGLGSSAVVAAPTMAMMRALESEYGAVITEPRVIPNGRTYAVPGDGLRKQPIVFSAGRLWDRAKNIETLCDAARGIDWPVYVAGAARAPASSAPPGPEVACDSVAFLGQLEAPAMRDWFERASIYALPARYEPFGLSVLEAAAAGCALVLGDIPSLRENWSDAALFVAPDDSKALAAAMRFLMQSDAERSRLASRARERATTFDIERTTAEYLRAYEDALAAHRRRGSE